MHSTRRPDSDEECDYPHPPPRRFQKAPLTLSQFMWGNFVPGFLFGATVGGGFGLAVGGLSVAFISNGSLIENVVVILAFVLGGALAGGLALVALIAGVLSFIIGIEWLFDVATRPFRGKIDPDADLGDPW